MRNASTKALTLAMVILLSPIATKATHAASPPANACATFRNLLAGSPGDAADFGCLPSEKRIELLSRPPAPSLIAPLDRHYRQHSALHRWKAQEAAALAVPPPGDVNPLSAYLASRDIEARRSEALKQTRQAIIRSEARILHLGGELAVATRATTQWIQRQPGRAPPAAYLQRIVSAADAILAEELLLKSRGAERDDLNQRFDEQLQQVLTLQG